MTQINPSQINPASWTNNQILKLVAWEVVFANETGWAGGIETYEILSGTMSGLTPVKVIDSRISVDTPYNIYFETQPAGHISRTTIWGKITLVSDDAGDTMNFKIVAFWFGSNSGYATGTGVFNGAWPVTVVDSRIHAGTPVNVYPATGVVGYRTVVASEGSFEISSTASETNVDFSWIAFTSTNNNPVSDEAYGSGWNGVTNVAPSKNVIYDKIESMWMVWWLVNWLDWIGAWSPEVAYRANYRWGTTWHRTWISAIWCRYDNIKKQILLSNDNSITIYNTNWELLNTVAVTWSWWIIHWNNSNRFILTKNGCQKINLDTWTVDNTLLSLWYKTLDISPDGSIWICWTYTSPWWQRNGWVATIVAFNTNDMSIINTITILSYEWFMWATLINNDDIAVILRTANWSTRTYTAHKYNIVTWISSLDVVLTTNETNDDCDMNCKYSPLDDKIYFIQPVFHQSTQIRTMDVDFTNINTIDYDPYQNWFFYRTSCDSLWSAKLYIKKYQKAWDSLWVPQIAEIY